MAVKKDQIQIDQPGQPTPSQYECNYLTQFFETVGLMHVMLDILCMVLSFFFGGKLLSKVCFCASSVQTWHLTWRTSEMFEQVLLNYFYKLTAISERLWEKVHATWRVGGFEFTVLQRRLKNVTRFHGRMFASAKGKQQKQVRQLQRREQCIDHIPYYLSGLSRAHFFPTTFLGIAVYDAASAS